jgi:hypothetical protein
MNPTTRAYAEHSHPLGAPFMATRQCARLHERSGARRWGGSVRPQPSGSTRRRGWREGHQPKHLASRARRSSASAHGCAGREARCRCRRRGERRRGGDRHRNVAGLCSDDALQRSRGRRLGSDTEAVRSIEGDQDSFRRAVLVPPHLHQPMLIVTRKIRYLLIPGDLRQAHAPAPRDRKSGWHR